MLMSTSSPERKFPCHVADRIVAHHSSISCAGPPPGLVVLERITPRPIFSTSPLPPSSPSSVLPEPVKLVRTTAGGLVLASMSGALQAAAPSALKLTWASEEDSQSTASPCADSAETISSAQEDQDRETADGHTKKKRSRFCKAKRDHYRRLVEQLVQLARDKPDSFSLNAVRLPRSIASSQEAREKLLATVARFVGAEA
mmetsp:Transcript_1086/g.2817  ORF Transcript_1086/g.2817 Transcript_1086/m.2817 type:complete len:200 (+) Transcript_1086:38-637(+)